MIRYKSNSLKNCLNYALKAYPASDFLQYRKCATYTINFKQITEIIFLSTKHTNRYPFVTNIFKDTDK